MEHVMISLSSNKTELSLGSNRQAMRKEYNKKTHLKALDDACPGNITYLRINNRFTYKYMYIRIFFLHLLDAVFYMHKLFT